MSLNFVVVNTEVEGLSLVKWHEMDANTQPRRNQEDTAIMQERPRLASEYRLDVITETITAQQEVERLEAADVLFVPPNLDTPGKKSEAIATITAVGWNGVFLILKDRPDFEAAAQFVIYVSNRRWVRIRGTAGSFLLEIPGTKTRSARP